MSPSQAYPPGFLSQASFPQLPRECPGCSAGQPREVPRTCHTGNFDGQSSRFGGFSLGASPGTQPPSTRWNLQGPQKRPHISMKKWPPWQSPFLLLELSWFSHVFPLKSPFLRAKSAKERPKSAQRAPSREELVLFQRLFQRRHHGIEVQPLGIEPNHRHRPARRGIVKGRQANIAWGCEKWRWIRSCL